MRLAQQDNNSSATEYQGSENDWPVQGGFALSSRFKIFAPKPVGNQVKLSGFRLRRESCRNRGVVFVTATPQVTLGESSRMVSVRGYSGKNSVFFTCNAYEAAVVDPNFFNGRPTGIDSAKGIDDFYETGSHDHLGLRQKCVTNQPKSQNCGKCFLSLSGICTGYQKAQADQQADSQGKVSCSWSNHNFFIHQRIFAVVCETVRQS